MIHSGTRSLKCYTKEESRNDKCYAMLVRVQGYEYNAEVEKENGGERKEIRKQGDTEMSEMLGPPSFDPLLSECF